MSIKTWIEGIIEDAVKTAVDEAITETNNAIRADLQAINATLASLPQRIVGDAEKDVNALLHEVTGTTSDIAQQVKTAVGFDPAFLVQQFISALIGR